MIAIRELTDQAALARLIADQPLNPFLQSWAWGEFQGGLGRKIWRLGAFDGNQLVGAALVIEHQLMLGKSYLYCPRGPLAQTPDVVRGLMDEIRELGKKNRAMFIKIDPGLYHFAWADVHVPESASLGTTLQPRHTYLIDTKENLDDVLAASHQKTRYNVRLAEKRGVTVRFSSTNDDLTTFLVLIHQTYQRQDIRPHPDSYYREQFTVLQQAGMMELVIAEYEHQPLVVNMVIWHGQTATYLHGASSDEHKDTMAPHLAQWRTIERCHERGITTYDLWGVTPPDQPDHHWQGISRFKRGFAGREIEFPRAVNIILQPQWYQTYRWAKRFRGGVDE